jgi:hypothetical protein
LISRSFRFSKKENDAAPAPKNRLGLITLHVPVSETAPVADVVFVHGLNGGSFSTWTKDSNPGCYWPQQWLPEEDGFEDVRIHSFGYPAAATRDSVLNVRDISRSLLAAVHDSPLMSKGEQVCLCVQTNKAMVLFG